MNNVERHQAQTRMVSNSRRFQEHPDNFPIAHYSEGEDGWLRGLKRMSG